MSINEASKSISSASRVIKSPSILSRQQSIKSSKSTFSVQKNSLLPQKEKSIYSETSNYGAIEKKQEIPKQCECGPDLYSRVLGPTADETILTGLQTLIDLCSKLKVCGDKDESDEEPAREQDIPEKDTSSIMKTSKSQTERNMVSAGFQVNPSVKTVAAQTAAFPEVVSEMLQTVGLTPEMVSKVMQTSMIDLPEKRKTSLASILMQTSNPKLASSAVQTNYPAAKPENLQTVQPDLQHGLSQTSSLHIPIQEETIERVFKEKTLEAAKGDEHKCISPPEPPDSNCKCCKCSSSSSNLREAKTSEEKALCSCGKRKSKCICVPGSKKSKHSVPEDKGEQPVEVRYAITKISKYKDFTTFEVTKSTRHEPRQIPKGIEGVFVLKKRNNDDDLSQGELNYQQKRRGSKDKNGMKVSKNGGMKNSNEKPKPRSKIGAY